MATKSKTNGAISDFINSLASSPVGQEVGNTASDLRQTIQVPVQQIAHAALPKIVPDVTPQQQQQAEQGSEFGMGAIQGQPEADALAPSINVAADTMKTAGKAAVQDAKETLQTAKAQPNGLQAGFIKLPKIGGADEIPKPPGKTITRINLKPSVYGAGREADVQSTVNNYVPGKTAGEQYANLQPTMDNFGQQITDIMQKNPKAAPLTQIMSDYDKNLNAAGIYRSTKLPKDAVQKEALSYINDLYNGAAGETSSVVPTSISDNTLYGLKQSVNQDAQSIYKKIDNGTSLTDREKVILAARQTIDDTLSTLHPDVKDLTTKQSHLYDAADSLYKGREGEINTPNPGFFGAIKKHPLGSAIALPLIGSAVTAGGYEATKLPYGDLGGAIANKATGNSGNANYSIDTSAPSHMGSADVKKATGLQYTYDDYQKDINDPRYVPGSNFKNSVDTKMAATDATATQNLPGQVSSFMGGTAQQALNAQAKVQGINLKGLQDVSQRLKTTQDYDAYTSNPKNPYAQELVNLKNANTLYGQAVRNITGAEPDPQTLIMPGDTAEMMKEKIVAQNKFIKDTYKQYQPYWDAKNPTNEVTTNQNTFKQNTGGTSAGTSNLPPIPSGFSMQQMTP